MLRDEGPFAGRRLESCPELAADEHVEVVAVLRAGETRLAGRGVVLRRRDRLVAVVTPEGRARLAPHFIAPKPVPAP